MIEILGNYASFVTALDAEIARAGIERRDLALMDHLCYRVETLTKYDELKEVFTRESEFLGEAIVGGRPISTFEFIDPLEAHGWRIPCLELPAPKEGSPYEEGLEHAEFVVIGGLQKFAEKYKSLPFETKGMSKKLNPELGLRFGSVAVKFHEQPLNAVVRIEQRLGL